MEGFVNDSMSHPDFGHDEQQLGPIGPLYSENHFSLDFSPVNDDHHIFRTSDKIDSEEIEIENAPRHSNLLHSASHNCHTSSHSKDFKPFKLRRIAPNPRHGFLKEKVFSLGISGVGFQLSTPGTGL